MPKFHSCDLVCDLVLSRKKVVDQVAVMEYGHKRELARKFRGRSGDPISATFAHAR